MNSLVTVIHYPLLEMIKDFPLWETFIYSKMCIIVSVSEPKVLTDKGYFFFFFYPYILKVLSVGNTLILLIPGEETIDFCYPTSC